MFRLAIAFLALGLVVGADETAKPTVKRYKLRSRLKVGQRYTGSNTISYKLTTTVREGDKNESFTEEVKRTERFVDKIVRTGVNDVMEIERSYLKLFTKARGHDGTPSVHQSPLQGRTVIMTERRRRRDVKLQGRGSVDNLVRRTAGLELDWRDVFPTDPVGPGDSWEGDADALARRIAPYLNIGSRSKMKLRFEEVAVVEGTKLAKLYVDWEVEGMRDRNLFTKAAMSGDVHFDLKLRRVVHVDMVGTVIVRGAVIVKGGTRIVKGTGPVTFQSSLKLTEAVKAAAEDE